MTSDRSELLDRRDFLLRSLEDLDRELELGDLEPEEHSRLKDRDEAQLAEVDAELARLVEPPPPGQPGQPRPPSGLASPGFTRQHRKAIGLAALGCFAAAAVFLSLALAGVAPFTSSTTDALPLAARIRTELGEAAVLAQNHNVVQAVAVYDDVLALEPKQPEALAEGGWLVRLAGLSTRRVSLVRGGDREIAEAVQVAPGLSVARAYYGVALFEDQHRPAAAVAQFGAMLADRPTSVLLSSVRSVAYKAYKAAGEPLPAQFKS